MDNCGFQITIEAASSDGENVRLKITSECESIQKLSEQLTEVNALQQIVGRAIGDSVVYRTASAYIKHPACLVPAAIVRTIEVETGMALPGKASISVEKIQS